MLRDVERVFVVQCRASGAFVDINMSLVNSLRHAARAESKEMAHEHTANAVFDGLLDFPDGYDVFMFYEDRQ